MAVEIERKFLVKGDNWRQQARSAVRYRQGYLAESGPGSVRVRIGGDRAHLNIKSATLDMQRHEYEYEIPLQDAEEMLDNLCLRPLVEKTRYEIPHGDHTWEVDVFEGDNEGLVVAEIELQDPNEPFDLPEWADEEVTDDTRYYNVRLVKHPYKDWR
jgi:adenylate cyclase